MDKVYLTIPCPFCNGNKHKKIDITEKVDCSVKERFDEVLKKLMKKEEVKDGRK